ncbi:MAG: shikimate kinase, partial [Pirellulales bacterium]
MTITLVGYRGTGKSSVAQRLADRLGLTAVDADAEIELRAGCTIREIFAARGEAGFRALERDVMADLLQRPGLVIAAGGGAVLNAQTRSEMRAAGPVVWLQGSPATIEARLQSDATTRERRPPLTAGDLQTEIATLLAVREPLYRDVASVAVATDDRDIADIVDEIVVRLTP